MSGKKCEWYVLDMTFLDLKLFCGRGRGRHGRWMYRAGVGVAASALSYT